MLYISPLHYPLFYFFILVCPEASVPSSSHVWLFSSLAPFLHLHGYYAPELKQNSKKKTVTFCKTQAIYFKLVMFSVPLLN